MKRIFNILFSLGLGFYSTTLTSQVMTLDSVLLRIEKSNLNLKTFNAKINALNEYAGGARSWDAPLVGPGLWMTPYNKPGNGSLMLSIEQMIPNPKVLDAKKNYLGSLSSEQAENKNYAKNQIFSYAKSTYFGWVILKNKLKVLKESQPLIELMIKSAEVNYSNADGKLNTIYKSKARLAGLQSMIAMAENEIQQKAIILNTLMNRDRNLSFDIDTSYQIKNYEIILPDSTLIQNNRSDIKAIDRSSDILKFKQKMESVKSKPSFGVRYSNMTPFNLGPSQFNLMGMMTIPIAPWSSKEYKANIKGLKFEIEELQWKKQNLINESLGKIGTITRAIKNSKQQISIYEQSIIPALENNLSTSRLAYGQNKEELFVVLDAWEALNMARIEYLNKIEELLYMQVEYEKEVEQK